VSIHFNCPECGNKLKAEPKFAGRRVKCTQCSATMLVPDADTPDQPAAPAPPVEEEPAIKFRRPGESASDDIDMTPMIDVVFQLLIFFMVTAAFGLQKAKEVPRTNPSEAAAQSRTIEELEKDREHVIVRLDAENRLWVNDVEAITEQELLAKLREARQSPSAPTKLLVLASDDGQYEKLVLALDAGAAVGMDDIQLAITNDEL